MPSKRCRQSAGRRLHCENTRKQLTRGSPNVQTHASNPIHPRLLSFPTPSPGCGWPAPACSYVAGGPTPGKTQNTRLQNQTTKSALQLVTTESYLYTLTEVVLVDDSALIVRSYCRECVCFSRYSILCYVHSLEASHTK